MNLLADEGMERAVVERLRADGHSVGWVAELAPSVPDEEVLRMATASGAVLLTEDKDCGATRDRMATA
jgi:predicted nuclease of predicted toxin-antitoxin system